MGRAVPAVVRALDILELFLDGETLTAPEITARLGLPRTTVHELVHTLTDRHYLSTVPDRPGHFRLGMRVFQLGGVFAGQLDLAREGQAVASEVAARCDETVHVAVLEGTEVVYVARSTAPNRSGWSPRSAAGCPRTVRRWASCCSPCCRPTRSPPATPAGRR
jgi:DNA-binding IclR family transcriptional regulator